ncbi:PAS modulated sigma54 specific transcriptional regulator, Fis family [uncultured Desulfobacterium sp.]|uniref:PAS modulated sigma54 specific transcriptional regulator, Fis family n=1 Tax=uncultured Desulfobacterium sp. TaxID=201089 RepID=A0A445N126_9BACT|nr:PAS modulated sigma54 specific transcriptional regulator, Fis family [uncultured Desulfobacterium sp.]
MEKLIKINSSKNGDPAQGVKFPVNEVDLYHRVFDVALDGISICDMDAIHVEVNEALCKMVGYSYDELIGKPVVEIVYPDYTHDLTEKFIPTMLKRGWVKIDSALFSKDGRKIPVEVHGAVFSHAGKPAFMAILRDLTERKRGEARLLASERRYRVLTENVTDAVMVIQDQKVVFANKVLISMFGYKSRTDVIGKDAGMLLDQDFRKNITIEQQEIADNDSKQPLVEEHRIFQGDREFWVESHWNVITWEEKPAVLVTLRDITTRKLQMMAIEKEKASLLEENIKLKSTMVDRYKFCNIVGISPAMQKIYDLILKASSSNFNVAIYGESGTGKELIAQTIHEMSDRRDRNYVPVNCAAIPEALLENEFFGCKKGAFTGAYSDKQGFFDLAHEGTLFLDEVGELSKIHQAKLLRAIEGGGYSAIGDTKIKTSNVRIIAATNRKWTDMLATGKMREDFFHRIHIIPITLPPLRERKEDIPLLVKDFCQKYSNKKEYKIPGTVIDALYSYQWPGNVRELENVVQRYISLGYLDIPTASVRKVNTKVDFSSVIEQQNDNLYSTLESFEKEYLVAVLNENHWHRGKAAESLGIFPKTLYRKMKKYGLA